MTDIAIHVHNLSKCYQIYATPRDRLKQFVLPPLRQMLGKAATQYYNEFWALKDVSFEVKKGETVGIIGRNGSGKSTLLQLICGTLTPTSGTIQTNGRIAALLELGSGFNPEFTGRENVYMNAAVLGLSKTEIDSRFDDIAAFADIGGFIDQPVKTYSSGMLVRLAFSVAINVDPEILIVDEALSVGDELFQRKCFSRIETIKNRGATILFVSHSGTSVTQLCDRAVLIHDGVMLLDESPRYAVKQYQRLLFSTTEAQEAVLKEIKTGFNIADNLLDESISIDGFYSGSLANVTNLSPVKYEKSGGEILEFGFYDHNHLIINQAVSGFAGLIKLKVRFDRPFLNVVFGFHLKSISGIEVAGLIYPSTDHGSITVMDGDVMEVVWHVKLSLLQGMYFFTYGVRSLIEPEFIHRIVDGMAIKITERKYSPAVGLCDISFSDQVSIKNLRA